LEDCGVAYADSGDVGGVCNGASTSGKPSHPHKFTAIGGFATSSKICVIYQVALGSKEAMMTYC
jgi:hypothetical protein